MIIISCLRQIPCSVPHQSDPSHITSPDFPNPPTQSIRSTPSPIRPQPPPIPTPLLRLRQTARNTLEETPRRSPPCQQILQPLRQLIAHRVRFPVAVLVEPPRQVDSGFGIRVVWLALVLVVEELRRRVSISAGTASGSAVVAAGGSDCFFGVGV